VTKESARQYEEGQTDARSDECLPEVNCCKELFGERQDSDRVAESAWEERRRCLLWGGKLRKGQSQPGASAKTGSENPRRGRRA